MSKPRDGITFHWEQREEGREDEEGLGGAWGKCEGLEMGERRRPAELSG